MQDAQDPSAAVPVDLPFFQPKCFSHYDPSTIFFYYIFLYNLLISQLIGTVKCTAKNLKCVSVLVFSVFKSKQIS